MNFERVIVKKNAFVRFGTLCSILGVTVKTYTEILVEFHT